MSANEEIADRADERLPVSVLTGFLGSGKTTLLRELLRRPDMARTAVIINEFGEIGLDHELVESSKEDVVVLNSGCLCCTVRSDLVDTLRSLYLRRVRREIPDFDRVVVETTGLADPAPVLHTLMSDPVLLARYRLDSVVTTVDAINGGTQLDNHYESIKQAAVADRLLLTKTDLSNDSAQAKIVARLKALNPAAPIISIVHGQIEPSRLFGAGLYNPQTKSLDVRKWLQDEAYAGPPAAHDHEHEHAHEHGHEHAHEHAAGAGRGQNPHDVNRHDDRIRSFSLYHEKPIPWSGLTDWLEMMATFRGDDLLRLKGILNVVESDRPVVIHGVQHVFHPPILLERWPSEDRRSRLVLITRDMKRATIDAMFQSFIKAAEPANTAGNES
jgi:G3E family GTPase